MVKRTTFTTITPLPANISRQVAIGFLHDHLEMIDLNPLVIERHSIPPPAHALSEERRCTWYSLTDKIAYLPGGVMTGQVTYTCAFHDLPEGLQTHCYAPMGLEIRDRWSVCGSLPGEPREPVELGLGAPHSGLYLREDVDVRCNVLMAGFVKKTLKKAHGSLVDRLATKVQSASADPSHMERVGTVNSAGSLTSANASWTKLGGASSTRSDSSDTPPVASLLPPSMSHQQQYAGQTLGPYGDHSPSNGSRTAPYEPESQASLASRSSDSLPYTTPPTTNPPHAGLSASSYAADYKHTGASPQLSGDTGLRPPPPALHAVNSQGSSTYSGHNRRQNRSPYSDASGQGGGPQEPGGLWPPPLRTQAAGPPERSLGYSGTVYRGNSKPQDYIEFSGLNPYEASPSPATPETTTRPAEQERLMSEE